MKEKWQQLGHLGVLFPPEYEYKRWKVYVNGEGHILEKDAEELAYAWAAKFETDYINDRVFQKNFWSDFSKLLPAELKNTNFPKDWDFSKMYSCICKEREKKKARPLEVRKQEKAEKAAIKERYGFATIDNRKVSLGNYMVEPPGLFMGRGKHPLRGHWKPRINPEDVTLNLSKDMPVPPCPLKGHTWMRVVENKNALWTAMWIEKLTGQQKRVLFSQSSFVRQKSDRKKFGKAITLANNFKKVNEFIEKKLNSRDPLTREIATVCNLIAKLTIRVGDEKGEDTADTVGASTLRVEHVSINGNQVIFDFLGKDSIRYHNSYTFDEATVRNIKELSDGKPKGSPIFPNVTSKDVNSFLSIVIPGLSAKQFRTATGSTLLAKELKKQNVDKESQVREKLERFTEANLQVAVQLNHHSAVSEAYENSLKNMKSKLKEIKQQLRNVRAESKKAIVLAKDKRDNQVGYAKNRWNGKKQRDAVRRAKSSYKKVEERYEKKINRLKERVKVLESKIKIKEQTKGIALGTSKLNYSDPRIIISFCKDKKLPVEKVYSKTVREKFEWAMDVDKNFYKDYPKVEE